MKVNQFKILIKQAVKEAFQEEIKGLLLEALSSKNTQEVYKPSPPQVKTTLREQYLGMVEGDQMNFNTENTQVGYRPINPSLTMGDGAALPPGEVDLSQITSLMNPKR